MSERGYQLVAFSGNEVRTFDLPRAGEVTIGRDEASAVRIDDSSVSRHHAVLRLGEALEIEDLGGANGTFVRRAASPGRANDTVHVNIQQLLGRSAPLAVGDCLLFRTACVAVRHPPRTVVPDLPSPDAAGSEGAAGVVVRDPVTQKLYADAARAARANISVLLLGETGVGKEVLARAIHAHSPRAKGPFTLERRRIVEALERSDGNQSEAARQLGMPRRTLVARLKGLGITRRHARPDESK